MVWQGKRTSSPESTTSAAKTNYEAFLDIRYSEVNANRHNEDDVSWQPPGRNFLKINIDFAMDDGNGIHDLGMVIHDERGQFIGAKSVQSIGDINSARGELLAI